MSSLYFNLRATIFNRNHNSNNLQWCVKCLKNSASEKLQILAPCNQYWAPLRVEKRHMCCQPSKQVSGLSSYLLLFLLPWLKGTPQCPHLFTIFVKTLAFLIVKMVTIARMESPWLVHEACMSSVRRQLLCNYSLNKSVRMLGPGQPVGILSRSEFWGHT